MRLRFFTDIAAAGLIVASLAYFFTERVAHEWLGLAAVLAMLSHNVLNRRWWKNPFAGTLDFKKALTCATNILLAVCVLALAVSGAMLSGEIFPFVPSGGGLLARQIHTTSAFWLFILSAFHAGRHAPFFSAAAKNLFPGKKRVPAGTPRNAKSPKRFIVPALAALLSVGGIFAFFRRSFPQKLSSEETFDAFAFGDALPRFLCDYLLVAALFFVLGVVVQSASGKSFFRKKRAPRKP